MNIFEQLDKAKVIDEEPKLWLVEEDQPAQAEKDLTELKLTELRAQARIYAKQALIETRRRARELNRIYRH